MQRLIAIAGEGGLGGRRFFRISAFLFGPNFPYLQAAILLCLAAIDAESSQLMIAVQNCCKVYARSRLENVCGITGICQTIAVLTIASLQIQHQILMSVA